MCFEYFLIATELFLTNLMTNTLFLRLTDYVLRYSFWLPSNLSKMAKQYLGHRQLQTQKLSPQQIQLMKLLQIPTATLDQRVQEELEANPALEEGENTDEVRDIDAQEKEEEAPKDEMDTAFDEYLQDYIDDDTPSYKLSSNNYSADNEDKAIPIPTSETFHENLKRQLGLAKIKDERLVKVALQIIGSIDEDGYLRRDSYSITNDLAFSQNISCEEEEVDALIKRIQKFEPAGIAARDLQECLIIQLDRKLATREDDPILLKAKRIITKYFSEFSKKHYTKLQRSLKVDESELKEIIGEIVKLNPKPAGSFSTTKEKILYIIPDFIVKNVDGELDLSLNSRNAPELKISHHYRDMLSDYKKTKASKSKKEKEAIMFIKQKIDGAKWFIDAIRQRQDTMYRSMYSIMQYQYDFFLTGDEKEMRPMILKDIADITGLDISTISRVANSKYVQTEFGTKRLKEFFSESIQTVTGEEVSTLEVKKILSELVDEESKKKPLSDEKLKDALQKKGYNIARRTVAKYREQLSIPVARLRKEL